MPEHTLITLGEPAGIGPDLMAMLAQRADLPPCVVVGDADCLHDRAKVHGLPLKLIAHDPHATPTKPHQAGQLYIHHVPLGSPCTPGQLCLAHADQVVQCLTLATQACLKGHAKALVTGPIHKAQLQQAGHRFNGHTEFLAQQCHCPDLVMFFHAPLLNMALVTTHLPLQQVSQAVTRKRIEHTITQTQRFLQTQLGIQTPRISVCGLNPHAGESGHLGTEEQTTLAPTLEAMREKGFHLHGPLPACTAFTPHHREQSDAFVCMYHDQGLGVLKALCFDSAVHVTLGLPFMRTSPDHGTALNLAGKKGIVTTSMLAAIGLAAQSPMSTA
tara:strand:+ start:1969 stop:2955 length:987 start_codon:yes stop_codon:yes gene_type:complete